VSAVATVRTRAAAVGARVRTSTSSAPTRASVLARTLDPWTSGALVLAVALFAVALRTTDQDAMNGYGLISVLGWPFFAALVLVCAAAGRELSRDRLRTGHLAVVVVVLIVILFGIQNGSDSAAGFPTAWLHVGFTQYFVENGHGVPFYDARFSWPGFFGAAATLVSLAGVDDASVFLRWAPVFYNLLALLPLVLLARHATSRAHVAWLGVLLYYCANWFEQDYFSPQATNLVLYLMTVAVLFWLGHAAVPGEDVRVRDRLRRWWHDGVLHSLRRLAVAVLHDRPVRVPSMRPAQYVAVELALVVVVTASVVSHQLTPVAMILALTAFSLTARTRFKGLWLIAGIVFIAWFSYGATEYWFGHLENVIGDVGKGGSTLRSGVSQRIAGDPAHLHVQFLRLAMSAGFGLLALVGLVLRRRSPWVPLLGALAFAPFLILGLQSYGGEVVIRCFLFATPMLVLLAAEIVAPIFRWPRRLVMALVVAILLPASVLQVTARGANQPFERMTSDQVAAVRLIESRLPDDSSVGYFNDFNPLALIPPRSTYLFGLADCTLPDDVQAQVDAGKEPVELACAERNRPDFVYASSSQAAYGTLVEGQPAGWLDSLVSDLIATGDYLVAVHDPHVTVLERIRGQEG